MQITNRNANEVGPLFLAAWLAAGDTGGGVVRGSRAAKIHAPEKKGGLRGVSLSRRLIHDTTVSFFGICQGWGEEERAEGRLPGAGCAWGAPAMGL